MDQLANIDRQVELRGAGSTPQARSCKVSDLRTAPFVVLLGEPGIGKTTVFTMEARREGAPLLKVRQLVNDERHQSHETLFIDSLDEYRSDGSVADKIVTLAKAIREAGVRRWRISCRSEDWRNEADIDEFRRTTGGEPILVVQLLPLNRDEAGAMLAALGETNPSAFLDKAHSIGASAFVENPLSLRLLYKTVTDGGAWPHTRFDLFNSATRLLAHENNPDRQYDYERNSPDDIVAAAGQACLFQLTTGAPGIWRSNAPPAPKHGPPIPDQA